MTRTLTSQFVAIMSLAVSVGLLAGDGGQILLREGFEQRLETAVVIHGANQPYEAHHIGLTTEKARSGKHSVKVDVSHTHGFSVYLAPRSNETPRAEWGRLGGPGTFVIGGLGIPLKPDRGYALTLYVWIEEASIKNPVRIALETATDCDYGVTRTGIPLPDLFPKPTNGWVKVEHELNSFLIDRLDASGVKTDGLRLDSISVKSFSASRGAKRRMVVYVDDIALREVPLAIVREQAERRARANAERRKALNFASIPEVEDQFIWGVYGGLTAPGPAWYALDKTKSYEDVRRQQTELVKAHTDWMLLDLRRHYCDLIVAGGGMIFPGQAQASFDYVQACLDKCSEYGVRLAPSTYLTQHYRTDASREVCQSAMEKATGMFKDHPALLAYLLVDEPGTRGAEDFYWGKQLMESLDPKHPCICFCNSVDAISEFAPFLPIVGIDQYPIRPHPRRDAGCWAVADSVRYARTLGARRIWSVSQVFGSGGSWRAPNVAEFRIQIFASLAEGATGFIPFVYTHRPAWMVRRGSGGTLVDPYGNPSPVWQEMKRLGPYLRSVGPLLVGAKRLPENAAVAQVRHTIVSNVGRTRPIAVARMFQDGGRGARYIVAHSNALLYRASFGVALRDMAADEQILDLFSMRAVPAKRKTFRVSLEPGGGRVYAVAPAAQLAVLRKEVLASRYSLRRDALELEIRLADKMGTDVSRVRSAVSLSQSLRDKQDFVEALEKLAEAAAILGDQEKANASFWPVHEAVEESREILGRINRAMTRCIVQRPTEFPKDASEVKAIKDRMIELSKRFYGHQSSLLRDGPARLHDSAAVLLADLRAFERRTMSLFAI